MSHFVFRSRADAPKVHTIYREVLAAWPVPKTELRLSTRQGETFVIACGQESAPPLVLLHGAQSNAAVWMLDVAVWSRFFRCYAVDMIGEAGFSAPVRPPLESDAHALWLDDVMRGLGLVKTSLVGVSLGGWLALDYGKRYPQCVERIALVCPAGIGRQKSFLLKVAPLLLLGPWGARRIREMVFGAPAGDPPTAARPLIELMRLIGRTIRPRLVKIPRLTAAELESLRMPMLAIVGGRDVLLDSAETRRRLAKHTPHAEVIFLANARHAIFGQTHKILAFLQGRQISDGLA
jgi:pimeloyl-ACP methyl ester carboxylesterase